MGTHSRPVGENRYFWRTERLWELAKDLPVKTVPIESIAAFDQDCWFGPEKAPTCRAVAAHAKRIYEADLNYPILLSADGGLMDGGHRIAKAWLLGLTEIAAAQFEIDPPPDRIERE